MLRSRQAAPSPTNDSSVISSLESLMTMYCEKYIQLADTNGKSPVQEGRSNQIQDHFGSLPPSAAPTNIKECLTMLKNKNGSIGNMLDDIEHPSISFIERPSPSVIIFVTLIALVSFISIVGNLCLAKVLHSKRFRLLQVDRVVLCLALSELCLVLIDSPTEIYRFLSYSFTYKWLCQFHTFFEAFFSSCILFYHLLGAFDRFLYIHGDTASGTSVSSKWYRYMSTKTGSIILLLLPILCSLPLAVCNALHARIVVATPTTSNCTVYYSHKILISLLISFYILPIVCSFILHGKLIHYIRSRPNQDYFFRAPYRLSSKRNELTDFQSKRRAQQSMLTPQSSVHRRFVFFNRRAMTSSTARTTSTLAMAPSGSLNSHPNNFSNSSHSTGSTDKSSSKCIPPPTVLYKINCQANANANRTVLLMILLLSFYICCWGPYNIYIWYHLYRTPSPSSPTAVNENLSMADLSGLRRFIWMNRALYLLSMVSMCFSFLFYFSLNKSARREFTRLFGCACPWTVQTRQSSYKFNLVPQQPNEYRHRYSHPYAYKNERIKRAQPSLMRDRCNTPKANLCLRKNTPKRMVLDYGCQIQCCP